eukprot:jgi/Bigna1/59275/fgenesh1_kg.3_\
MLLSVLEDQLSTTTGNLGFLAWKRPRSVVIGNNMCRPSSPWEYFGINDLSISSKEPSSRGSPDSVGSGRDCHSIN